MANKTKTTTATPKAIPAVEVRGDGKGDAQSIPPHMQQFLSGGMLMGLTTSKEMPNAINMLVQPGEDAVKILMRVKFKSRPERIAGMHILAQCVEFHDDISTMELFWNLAATVSEGGEGRNQLVTAIIGDRNIKEGAKGMGNWIREKAGFGSGQEQ